MGITRELDKEFLLNYYSIYINYTWSMLLIFTPALMSIFHPYICFMSTLRLLDYILCPDLIFQIFLLCSRPMTSHYVICQVTIISHASLLSKIIRRKEKEKKGNINPKNVYKEKKIVSVQSIYNTRGIVINFEIC